jgi:hypothetical protein
MIKWTSLGLEGNYSIGWSEYHHQVHPYGLRDAKANRRFSRERRRWRHADKVTWGHSRSTLVGNPGGSLRFFSNFSEGFLGAVRKSKECRLFPCFIAFLGTNYLDLAISKLCEGIVIPLQTHCKHRKANIVIKSSWPSSNSFNLFCSGRRQPVDQIGIQTILVSALEWRRRSLRSHRSRSPRGSRRWLRRKS